MSQSHPKRRGLQPTTEWERKAEDVKLLNNATLPRTPTVLIDAVVDNS